MSSPRSADLPEGIRSEDDMIIESFFIRLWIDRPVSDEISPSWHGQITHVTDGKRMQFDNIGQICHFVASYLESCGVPSGIRSRLLRKLFPWKARGR